MKTNKDFIKKISETLKSIASKTTPPGAVDGFNFTMHDGVIYSLPDEETLRFNETIKTILKHNNNSKKFSSEFIEKKIKKIFAEILIDPLTNTEESLTETLKELSEYNNKSTIYLRIDGIAARACLNIGNVKLTPADEFILSKLNEQAIDIINTVKTSQENKEHYTNEIKQTIENELKGGCIAIVEANAEPIRAFEIAKEEAGYAIDLLRLACSTLFPITEDIRIGLKGDYPTSSRQAFIFSANGLQTKGDNIGSVRGFELDENAIKQMRSLGIFKISDALTKTQANNLEETLIKSIHWYSASKTQYENGNKLLCLIISLECLFKAESGNSIGGTVAESVALVTAKSLESRKELIRIVRDSYSKRSGVAHGGKKLITDTDIHTLTIITLNTIFKVIERLDRFKSQKELMTWIEELKLS